MTEHFTTIEGKPVIIVLPKEQPVKVWDTDEPSIEMKKAFYSKLAFLKQYSPIKIGDTRQIDCPECKGAGEWEDQDCDSDGWPATPVYTVTCPDCKGTGKQSIKVTSRALRQWIDIGNGISMADVDKMETAFKKDLLYSNDDLYLIICNTEPITKTETIKQE